MEVCYPSFTLVGRIAMETKELRSRILNLQAVISELRDKIFEEIQAYDDIRLVPKALRRVRRTIELNMAASQALHRLDILDVSVEERGEERIDEKTEALLAGIVCEVAKIENDVETFRAD
jgi:hypothetical protein